MTNAANRTDDLYIYNENSDQGFPWDFTPHSIPKSSIEMLSISGELGGKRLRIAANSFQGYSNLKTVLLDDVTGIDSYAFEGCSSLKSVAFVYAAELTTIGKGAFKNCTSLSKMEIPGNLTHIGDEAFQNTALGTITLGRSVTEIGSNAFSGCRNLKVLCYDGSVAHRYAQDNNIPFELIQEVSVDTKVKEIPVKFYTWYDGVSNRTLAWGLDLFNFSSFDYVGNFAELELTLSAATENSSAATEVLLNDLGFKTVKSENYFHSWEDIYWPGVTFGHQEINILPASPGGFHIRAKPYVTSTRVPPRKYGLPAARDLILATRKRVY